MYLKSFPSQISIRASRLSSYRNNQISSSWDNTPKTPLITVISSLKQLLKTFITWRQVSRKLSRRQTDDRICVESRATCSDSFCCTGNALFTRKPESKELPCTSFLNFAYLGRFWLAGSAGSKRSQLYHEKELNSRACSTNSQTSPNILCWICSDGSKFKILG